MTKHAIILLAGIGSRLHPLTLDTHKALIEINGKTILETQISQLYRLGIKNFHLVLGYRADDIIDFTKNSLNSDAIFHYYNNPHFTDNNTAYSLMLASHAIDDDALLLDGDVLMSDDVLLTLMNANKTTLLCDTDRTHLDEEAVKFKINSEKEIIKIGKAIPLDQAIGESIGVGLYQSDWLKVLNTFITEEMNNKDNWKWYYEDAIDRLLLSNQQPSEIHFQSTENHPWVEIDTHEDLQRAKELF